MINSDKNGAANIFTDTRNKITSIYNSQYTHRKYLFSVDFGFYLAKKCAPAVRMDCILSLLVRYKGLNEDEKSYFHKYVSSTTFAEAEKEYVLKNLNEILEHSKTVKVALIFLERDSAFLDGTYISVSEQNQLEYSKVITDIVLATLKNIDKEFASEIARFNCLNSYYRYFKKNEQFLVSYNLYYEKAIAEQKRNREKEIQDSIEANRDKNLHDISIDATDVYNKDGNLDVSIEREIEYFGENKNPTNVDKSSSVIKEKDAKEKDAKEKDANIIGFSVLKSRILNSRYSEVTELLGEPDDKNSSQWYYVVIYFDKVKDEFDGKIKHVAIWFDDGVATQIKCVEPKSKIWFNPFNGIQLKR